MNKPNVQPKTNDPLDQVIGFIQNELPDTLVTMSERSDNMFKKMNERFDNVDLKLDEIISILNERKI